MRLKKDANDCRRQSKLHRRVKSSRKHPLMFRMVCQTFDSIRFVIWFVSCYSACVRRHHRRILNTLMMSLAMTQRLLFKYMYMAARWLEYRPGLIIKFTDKCIFFSLRLLILRHPLRFSTTNKIKWMRVSLSIHPDVGVRSLLWMWHIEDIKCTNSTRSISHYRFPNWYERKRHSTTLSSLHVSMEMRLKTDEICETNVSSGIGAPIDRL